MSNNKTILLSGSAGFIGTNFVRQCIYEKWPYEIVSVDKLADTALLNNIYNNNLHKFYPANICDEHIMDRIFDYHKPEIVINMAAESNVDKSIKNCNTFIQSNIAGTQNLINLSLKHKAETFVQISTDETNAVRSSVNEEKVTEEYPLNPKNPYSASKAAAELLVQAAHNTHGLQYIITRCTNNYGIRQDNSKLIPRTIKHIIEDRPIIVYGKGLQMRDWLHVSDHCLAIKTILEKGNKNEIYNISGDQELTNIDVVHKLIKQTGANSKISFVEDRPGHDFRYGVNSEKLKKLGWKPRYRSFDDGIIQVIEWYHSNYWFIK